MKGGDARTRWAWCLAAVAAALLAGCDAGPVGVDEPAEFERILLGHSLTPDLQQDVEQGHLGFALERTARNHWSGESRDEVIRAIADDDGRVVAKHALRTWQRRSALGGTQEVRRFTLEARLPEPAGKATLDEDLLRMAQAEGLGDAPRGVVPGVWKEIAPHLLDRLNRRRTARGLPPRLKAAEGTTELMLVAEMLLETVPTKQAERMDRAVWGALDLPGAIRRLARQAPIDMTAPLHWSQQDAAEAGGKERSTLDRLLVGQPKPARCLGSVSYLGAGRMRLVLERRRGLD